MGEGSQSDITALTVQLLSAFVSNNTVASENLADLIRSTRSALADEGPAVLDAAAEEAFSPAVSVRRSLASPDYILSLIDGKPYKTLKRHLAMHGLTPQQYRERYKLPASYPMVAKSYSEARREVAARLGLGKRTQAAADTPTSSSEKDSAASGQLPARKSPNKPNEEKVAAATPAPLDAEALDATEAPSTAPVKKAGKAKRARSTNATQLADAETANAVGKPSAKPRKKLSIANAAEKQSAVDQSPLREAGAAKRPADSSAAKSTSRKPGAKRRAAKSSDEEDAKRT